MAGRDVVGQATYTTAVDASGVDKGLDDAERRIKQTGKATEDAFARQGTQAVGRFRSALNGLVAKVDGLGQRGGITGALLGGVGLGAGLGAFNMVQNALSSAISYMDDAIDAASALSESQSKVGVVFRDNADDIEAWSDTAAEAMGLSKQAALEAAGTFGNLFDALKLSADAQRDMSKGAVQLASDLASFNNADVGETLQAIQSGLLGEAEPMRRFGSNLSEARVQAYALAQGWVKGKQALSDAMKVQARYNLILEDTKNAQGDFLRTSDGLANSQRTLAAQLDDVMASIGQELIPVMTVLARTVKDDVMPAVKDLIRTLKDAKDSGLLDAVLSLFSIPFDPTAPLKAGYQVGARLVQGAAKGVREYSPEFLAAIRSVDDYGIEDAGVVAARHFVGGFLKTWNQLPSALSGQELKDALAKLVEGLDDDKKSLLLGLDIPASLRTAIEASIPTVKAATKQAVRVAGAELEGLEPMATATMERIRRKGGKGWRWKADISSQLSDLRSQFKTDMAAIDYLLRHRQGKRTRNELEDQLTALEKKARKALREKNWEAYERIQQAIAGINSELTTLNGREVTAKINMWLAGPGHAGGMEQFGTLGRIFGYRAEGGPVRKGWPYVVGERRAEVFVPESNGRIVPSVPQYQAMAGQSSTVRHTGTVEVRLSRDTIAQARAQGASWADLGRMAGAAAGLIARPSDVLTPMEAW